jgi:uncharacterized protein with GYD domain
MPGYVTLLKYTQQGVANIKESPDRLKVAKAAGEKMGIRCVGAWVTMGEYDLVIVWDAPDDQAIAAFVLAQARMGNVASQTLRAFSEEEFAQIVGKLP